TGKRRQEDAVTRDVLIREGMDGVSGLFGRFTEKLHRLALLFEQADSPIKPETFFGMTFGTGLAAIAIGFIVRAPVPLLPICALMGGSLPLLWLLWRRRGRFK